MFAQVLNVPPSKGPMIATQPTCPESPGSPLALYLQQIHEPPRLNATQEKELAHRIQQGDREARDHLVRANLRLVATVARGYMGKGVDLADLIAEGSLGLLRAAEGFDPAMNTRFSTYAVFWVRQSIRRALLNSSRTVRLPAYMVQILRQWRRATATLREELGRPPADTEVARCLKLSNRRLRLVRNAIRVHNATSRGEQREDVWTLDERLVDGCLPSPETILAQADQMRDLLRLVDGLDPRSRAIIRLRFGLDGQPPKNLREIGEVLGLTRERVRQIERLALAQLQKMLADS
jgi:RNA polymerase primary sigma factor